jgi:hypothetical protein
MRIGNVLFIFLVPLLAGCGDHGDPCVSGRFFDDGPCNYWTEQGYRDLVWIDSAGLAHTLDTSGYVTVMAGSQTNGSASESRSGFFLDSAGRSDGCRLAITYSDFPSWPTGKDTVRTGGVRLQGFRDGGSYPPWVPDDACGRSDFPDGVAWIVRTDIQSFPDDEGSGHGKDETYGIGVRWARERVQGIFHSRSWTVINR